MIAIAEFDGAIHDPNGLAIDKVAQHRTETGSITGFPNSKNLPHRDAALELPCDILIPAALENVITKENVARIQAKIVGEAANGPTTADASEELYRRGVLVIPDSYLNAGGVTVSYFEWLKNLSHVRFGRMEKRFEERAYRRLLSAVEGVTERHFTEEMLSVLAHGPDEKDLVYSGLEETMSGAYQEIRDIQNKLDSKADLRTAALIDAIDKIAICYMEMGIFP